MINKFYCPQPNPQEKIQKIATAFTNLLKRLDFILDPEKIQSNETRFYIHKKILDAPEVCIQINQFEKNYRPFLIQDSILETLNQPVGTERCIVFVDPYPKNKTIQDIVAKMIRYQQEWHCTLPPVWSLPYSDVVLPFPLSKEANPEISPQLQKLLCSMQLSTKPLECSPVLYKKSRLCTVS